MNTNETGDRGEKLVADYLRKHGFIITATNYRCRRGEIDIIAENNAYILFVEVKSRSGNMLAAPREAVDKRKCERILATAQYYIIRNAPVLRMRFDVAEVYFNDDAPPSINYIENAFGAD